MKTGLLYLITATVLGFAHNSAFALATSGCQASKSCLSNCDILVGNEDNCMQSDTKYYSAGGLSGEEYGGIISCTACRSGSTLTQASIMLASNCTVTYKICECACSTSSWAAANTGYEKRTVCNQTTCAVTTEYRCAKGYYGTSTNGTSGCTPCPSSGTTASAGKTSRTACFIPNGGSFNDNTGSGVIDGGNCYWSE